MSDRSAETQLVKFLTDVHSIEEQAIAQMRRAPEITDDPELTEIFKQHLGESEEHRSRVASQLERLGADPSTFKDLAGRAGGVGMALFPVFQPDDEAKLVAHAYSYEHMEIAAYELLGAAAMKLGDQQVAELAGTNGKEEHLMADRLAGQLDSVVDLVLAGDKSLDSQLDAYLSDAHAVEGQALELCRGGKRIAGDDRLAEIFSAHQEQTGRHRARIEERLEARGGGSSTLKDAALRLGGLNLGAFFAAQPDTPAKIAGFSFAFEHLEVALYEILGRVAERAVDEETERAAREICAEERDTAQRVEGAFSNAMESALEDLGVEGR